MDDRLKAICISEQLLMEMCKQYATNIPKNAEVQGCYYNPLVREIVLITHSASWPEIPEWHMVERIRLEKRDLRKKKEEEING